MKKNSINVLLIGGFIFVIVSFFEGWFSPKISISLISFIFIAFIVLNFYLRKYERTQDLSQTVKSAERFFKERVYGKDVPVDLIDLEGFEIEKKKDNREKQIYHRFLIHERKNIDPKKSLIVMVEPKNPHPRLIGYKRGVVIEDISPIESGLELIEKKEQPIVVKRTGKGKQEVEVKVKSEQKPEGVGVGS